MKTRTSGYSSDSEQTKQQDLSVLRKPILTSLTGFLEAKRAFDNGTEEIRRLLTRECDIMYECKVCRNVFRSLTNFISHKRVYCREPFTYNLDTNRHGFIDQDISTIIQAEQDFVNQNTVLSKNTASIPNTNSKSTSNSLEKPNKDLSSIIERLVNREEIDRTLKLTDFYDQVTHKLTQEEILRKHHVLQLDRVPNSSIAVYQTIKRQDCDNIKTEVNEVHELLNNKTVLGLDGKVLPSSLANIKIESNGNAGAFKLYEGRQKPELEMNISCDICNLKFLTEKTLKLHIQTKHITSTYVYQCPSCSQTFLQAGAVVRHLSNDHKKSLRRIRLMRESIYKKRMRLDEVQVKGPSRELARLQIDREKQQDAEKTKAWMENIERSPRNSPLCTYCGKKFERRAVLTTHLQTCNVKNRQTPTFSKKIIDLTQNSRESSASRSSTSSPAIVAASTSNLVSNNSNSLLAFAANSLANSTFAPIKPEESKSNSCSNDSFEIKQIQNNAVASKEKIMVSNIKVPEQKVSRRKRRKSALIKRNDITKDNANLFSNVEKNSEQKCDKDILIKKEKEVNSKSSKEKNQNIQFTDKIDKEKNQNIQSIDKIEKGKDKNLQSIDKNGKEKNQNIQFTDKIDKEKNQNIQSIDKMEKEKNQNARTIDKIEKGKIKNIQLIDKNRKEKNQTIQSIDKVDKEKNQNIQLIDRIDTCLNKAEIKGEPLELDKIEVLKANNTIISEVNKSKVLESAEDKTTKEIKNENILNKKEFNRKKFFKAFMPRKDLVFYCRICKKSFNALSNLRRHISMFHYRRRKFGCHLCPYRAFRKYDVTNHLNSAHSLTGEKIIDMILIAEDTFDKDDIDGDIIISDNGEIKGENEENIDEIKSSIATANTSKNKSLTEDGEIVIQQRKGRKPKIPKVVKSSSTESSDSLSAKSIDDKNLGKLTRSTSNLSISSTDDKINRRPIRNRVKPVNKDFVYDLSNLLKKDMLYAERESLITARAAQKRRNTIISLDESSRESSSSLNGSFNSQYNGIKKDDIPRPQIKGSAQIMAQLAVSRFKACFNTPPELPTERPIIPPRLLAQIRQETFTTASTFSNVSTIQSNINSGISSLFKGFDDMKKVKNIRRISDDTIIRSLNKKRKLFDMDPASLSDTPSSRLLRKVDMNINGTESNLNEENLSNLKNSVLRKSTGQLNGNSSNSNDVPFYTKQLEHMKCNKTKKGEKIIVKCPTEKEFQEYLIANKLTDPVKKINVPTTPVEQSVVGGEQNNQAVSTINSKRITLLQRLAENKNKKLQESLLRNALEN